MLKRKVSSVVECFLDSHSPPTVQVNKMNRMLHSRTDYPLNSEVAGNVFTFATISFHRLTSPVMFSKRQCELLSATCLGRMLMHKSLMKLSSVSSRNCCPSGQDLSGAIKHLKMAPDNLVST